MSTDYRSFTKQLKIKEKINETANAVSLVFEIPTELKKDFIFQPGQFVTLFLELKDEVLPRSYSISSSPLVDPEFKITIKRVPGGRGSTHLVDEVKAGDVLFVTPPAGHFFRPPKSLQPHHFILFAAGSGITPIFSILKSVLLNQENHVSLLFANSNESAIIYKDELTALLQKYSTRLNITHVLSQPSPVWPGLKGRPTRTLIETFLKTTTAPSTLEREFYVCGPNGFMDTVKSSLRSQGVSEETIHQEVFTSSSPISIPTDSLPTMDDPPGRVYIGTANAGPLPDSFKLIALVSGQEYQVQGTKDQTILEVLMAAGANPPYSCMDGACMACIAKVREGRVYQNDPGILMDENIESQETLTCQARAASALVKIDYDSI